jgi:hypothetical protein
MLRKDTAAQRRQGRLECERICVGGHGSLRGLSRSKIAVVYGCSSMARAGCAPVCNQLLFRATGQGGAAPAGQEFE